MKPPQNKKLNTINFTLLLGGTMLFLSCRPVRLKQTAEPVEKSAFYTLVMTRDSVSKITKAEIKSVVVVDLKIRYDVNEMKAQEPDFLKIEILYPDNKIINAFTEHPLYKRLDLYSESGKIESKSISLSQGEVTLRVPYFEKYKKIIITQTVNFKEDKPIILKNEK